MNYSPLIEVAELLKIRNNSDVVIIDASNGVNARSNYDKLHLENALFVDLNSQLAEVQEDLSKGGRHPLPSFSLFENSLASLGISEKSHVIIYDQTNSSNAAARFWWMLTAIGHPKVQVLNGGFNNALKQSYPSNNSLNTVKRVGVYKIEKWLLPISNLLEVKQYSMDKSFAIIDVRESGRYLGEFENLDLVAGHIPNAINIPFIGNLDEHGFFLTREQLKKKYGTIFDVYTQDKVIVHCGSGVTACHTLLAMTYAGYQTPSLYVGSWSEWSRSGEEIVNEFERNMIK
jgi:thiosulfate/3-mercaptopyruvate sulfurtransferase